jgi:hypothetical protein
MSSPVMWRTLGIVSLVLLAFALLVQRGHAHDADPSHDEWYRSLKQPDAPAISCCGTADAYWCDTWYVRDSKTYCRITDDRDDAPLMRPHVAIGTEVYIPDYKLKWDAQNPTGHAVVFLGPSLHTYCFVQSSGT